jgi:hypothetical protein
MIRKLAPVIEGFQGTEQELIDIMISKSQEFSCEEVQNLLSLIAQKVEFAFTTFWELKFLDMFDDAEVLEIEHARHKRK